MSEIEISMSVEETNRMRAALGLAPLAVTSESDKRAEQASIEEERRKAAQEIENAKQKAEALKQKKQQSLSTRVLVVYFLLLTVPSSRELR